MIKLIHLLSQPNQIREINSINSLKPLEKSNINYIQYINKPYNKMPPKNNCFRPKAVVLKNGKKGQLWCGHYGAWLAHKEAIKKEFNNEFLIVCECDCNLLVEPKDFIEDINKAIIFMKKQNVVYLSFGNNEPNITYSKEDFTIVNSIFKTHCIIFNPIIKKFLLNCFEKEPWDNIDFFYNRIFNNKYKIAISNELKAIQLGKSLIDIKTKLL